MTAGGKSGFAGQHALAICPYMTVEETSQPIQEPVLLEATLFPHRSLGPSGFAIVMGTLCLLCFTAGMVFMYLGAWPVIGFFGLDVLLVYLAFRLNYRAARQFEKVRLTERLLTVLRVDPSGNEQRWEFQPFWLRVELRGNHPTTERIVLSSHGRSLPIGAFLTPDERQSFAAALRDALRGCQVAPSPA